MKKLVLVAAVVTAAALGAAALAPGGVRSAADYSQPIGKVTIGTTAGSLYGFSETKTTVSVIRPADSFSATIYQAIQTGQSLGPLKLEISSKSGTNKIQFQFTHGPSAVQVGGFGFAGSAPLEQVTWSR